MFGGVASTWGQRYAEAVFSLLVPVGCYVPVTIILLNQVFQMSERSSRKEVLNIREYGRYLLICLVLWLLMVSEFLQSAM